MLWAGAETPTRNPPRRGGEENLTSPAGDVPVLVVDDDPNFCTAVERALASVPLRPFAVPTAVDALRFLARTAPFDDAPRPAFIVLDFNLPDRKAPAVLADLRADPRLRAIPVLVLSQIPGLADEQAAFGAGAQAYHGKPSRMAALRELLLEFWHAHGGSHGDPGG